MLIPEDKRLSVYQELQIHTSRTVRIVLLIIGFFLVVVGIAGMFLPLLPTTIFFILAAWCFARSSERFYYWIHTNKLFGKYLTNYRTGRGMTAGSKIFTLIVLWLGIGYSALVFTHEFYIKIILLIIAVGVSIHILMIKTVK